MIIRMMVANSPYPLLGHASEKAAADLKHHIYI